MKGVMPISQNFTVEQLFSQFPKQWKEYDINKLLHPFPSIKISYLEARVIFSRFRQRRMPAISEYACRMHHLSLLWSYTNHTYQLYVQKVDPTHRYL